MTLRDWQELRDEILREAGPQFQKEYEGSLWIVDLVGLRVGAKLTQKQVAEMVGTTQSVISRLESGAQEPTLRFLRKIVEALGGRLVIRIEPAAEGDPQPVALPKARTHVDATV